MPHCSYPLRSRFQRRGIASLSYPLEISDANGKALFIAREKFKWFQANTFHVFSPEKAGKNDPDLFQMLPITGQGLDRGVDHGHPRDPKGRGIAAKPCTRAIAAINPSAAAVIR